jgi:uncharacterized protein
LDLTLEKPGDHLFIRSVSNEGIQVVDEAYRQPIILSASSIITDWTVTSAAELQTADAEKILELKPEIVLIGTGERQVFLPPELMVFFYSQGAGIEVMNTEAACRTFNVLVSESRNVVAALIPLQ